MKFNMKEEKRHIFEDSILHAYNIASEAIKDVKDEGTCNLDCVLVERENPFTYDETIDMFESMAIRYGIRVSVSKSHIRGYVSIYGGFGQADRNTVWCKTFAKVLCDECFKASVDYRID